MSQAEALCRLCSKEKKPMVAILDNNPLNVREKMEKLVKIRVSPLSFLPKQICLECLTKLNTFNEFYVQIHENQVILQLLFGETTECIDKEKEQTVTIEAQTQTDVIDEVENHEFIIIKEFNEDSESQAYSTVDYESEPEQLTMEIEEKVEVQDHVPTEVDNRNRRKYDRFDCYVCNEQFPGNFQFIQHFNAQHPEQELKYKCYLCDKFVKKYRSFTRHLECHTEKRFSCDVCNQRFSQKITLVNHMTSHTNIKKFECNECGLSFKQNSSLFKHRKQKHSTNVPNCTICNRTFVNNETYQQHLRSKHNQGEKNIVCEVEGCNKKFASKSALSYHRYSIHSKKGSKEEMKCQNCDDKFKNQITLTRHMKKCGK